jgi:MSHA biogenesis protein MshO
MNKSSARGFTLIEAVLTITIMGILAGTVAKLIVVPVESYIDTVRRANLTDTADGALRRIARDVHAALPNSFRSTSPASNSCIEFLPVVGGGRYRSAKSGTGTGDILDFSAPDNSFDVLADNNSPTFSAGVTYHTVIYNLGIPGADAYDASGVTPNRAAINSTATESNIVFNAANQFPFESPGKRFHVIPNYSVVYSCDALNRQLIRSKRPLTATQMGSCPGAGDGDVLASNVSTCSFSYTPAVSQRNGQFTMRLGLTQSGESVQLYQEVHVDNIP